MSMEIIVFDVNETLLDLKALDKLFLEHFGSSALRATWFNDMLITAMTLNHIQRYEKFSTIGMASLQKIAELSGKQLTKKIGSQIIQAMESLPPHEDVVPALERLTSDGITLAALTNSSHESASKQLKHSGLERYFSTLITVDEVKHMKPANQVYKTASESLQRSPSALTMVAAHTWDLAGAAFCGWSTALVCRNHQVPNPLYPKVDVVATSMEEVCEQIINRLCN